MQTFVSVACVRLRLDIKHKKKNENTIRCRYSKRHFYLLEPSLRQQPVLEMKTHCTAFYAPENDEQSLLNQFNQFE